MQFTYLKTLTHQIHVNIIFLSMTSELLTSPILEMLCTLFCICAICFAHFILSYLTPQTLD
jgi:hypothetical protein